MWTVVTVVNAHDMDQLKTNCDSSAVQYLNTLLTSKEDNIKFDFYQFMALIQSEDISNEVILFDILTSIFQLLEKCGKNFQMCSNMAHSFCVSVSLLPHGTSVLFDILQKKKLNLCLNCASNLDEWIEPNYNILVLGILKFFSTQKFQFQADQCKILNANVVSLVTDELLDRNNVNTLLCTIETWLSVVSETDIDEKELRNVYESIFSVAIIYWNMDITEFRNLVENLFFKCLCLNYEKNRKKKPYVSVIQIIVNMETLRSITLDMLWALPFKYYAYVLALKFVNKHYSLPKFLKYIRDDLRVGLMASLKNKRVISVETELFKFCTNYAPFDDWTEIFHPLTKTILASPNMIVANNFSRYWLPVIVRNFPQYAIKILDRIREQPNRRSMVHSRILFALFKVCHLRKVRFTPAENSDQLSSYLQTFFFDSEDTLGELFALLCNLGDQSTVHSPQEFRAILIFLKNHAKTNSTILRQHMFSSFAKFVLRLICSNVKVIRANAKDTKHRLSHVMLFLADLNQFFVDGLEPGCSYQRKLISLILYKIFMTYALRDCGGQIRRNNLKDAEKFINFARACNSWEFNSCRNCSLLFRCLMDPCEEIQNLSFSLLRTFFDLSTVNYEPRRLFSDFSKLLTDSLFYKRNSGVSAVLSLICLSYNTGNDAHLPLLEGTNNCALNFTDMFLSVLESQVVILQEDILNSAVHHPLDSTIKILMFLMTDINSPEYHILTKSQIEKLISLFEIAVPLLLKALFIDKFSDYAPSFEESDIALETIIQKSQIVNDMSVRDSDLNVYQLKPVNQILLNFIWTTLKVCSELESYLISGRFYMLNETLLIRCSELVVQKLKLCRHKGVIEAAGISLSNIVKILTMNNSCEKWLESIICETIYLIEHKAGATVSRKSAGLSLLVQNIVGNDRRTNKPLLAFCWTEFHRILNVDFNEMYQTVLEELPQTHALHFLKVLTADARNNEELSAYFEEIALVCLKSLKAPIWTIRNAALQLFGAIVPKMVGQKNSQNDFGVRRSFEEVFLRMPALLHYIVSTFETVAVVANKKLTRDSDLVPLLTILMNIQVSSVHLMKDDLFSKLRRLRKSLKYLLSSELHFVRELAGKSFVSLHCESEITIFKTMVDDVVEYVSGERTALRVRNENHLHGYLLVLKQVYYSYAETPNFQKRVKSQRAILPFNSNLRQISLKSAALLYELEIISCANTDPLIIVKYMARVLNDLPYRKHLLLGYDEWSYVLLNMILKYCTEYSFLKLASYCLSSSHSSIKTNFLKLVSASPDSNLSPAFFNLLISHLRKSLGDFTNADPIFQIEIFNTLIKISAFCEIPVDQNTFCELFDSLILTNHHEFKATNLLVLCLLKVTPIPRQLEVILQEIFKLLDPAKSNRDIRFNSATSLLSLLNKHKRVIDLHLAWLCIIEVVQDEETEIRSIGCESYRSLKECFDSNLNPEIVLGELFNLESMRTILPVNVAFTILWDTVALKNFDTDVGFEIANPFNQGVLNVYKEYCRTVSLAGQSLVKLLQVNLSSITDASGSISIVIRYYDSFIQQVLQNAEHLLQNHFLLSSESYVIILKCYYLLLVFIELFKDSASLWSIEIINTDNLISRAEKLCCNLRKILSVEGTTMKLI